ncbi:MAG TPA: hypothetical protein VGM56_15815 [Byssovorax sp.]
MTAAVAPPGTSDAPSGPRARAGWLRGPAFDVAFTAGPFALALLFGAFASRSQAAFVAAVWIDVWLLAYPHVLSTFTRIAVDAASRRAHRFLLVGAPPIVLAVTASVAWLGGAVGLNSLYYYAQTYHYTMQSYGLARAYRRSAGGPARDLATDAVVFAFPIWGVLHRASSGQSSFYGAPLLVPPVPAWAATIAGIAALGALAAWIARRARSPERREIGGAMYVASHVLVTVLGYVVVRDVTLGWLLVNVWHNAQYLMFVWSRNVDRHGDAADAPGFASLRRADRALPYAAVCLAASTAFYLALGRFGAALAWTALPALLVLHQSVNFHHYLVDAFIWRRRSPSPVGNLPTSNPRAASGHGAARPRAIAK